MMEFIEMAKVIIPFEKLYQAALDYIIIDIPSPEVIDSKISGGGMYPEEAYPDYLNTLVDNLNKADENIEAVIASIKAKIASGELEETPELTAFLHELSHERVEVISRVKIGPEADDWIDFKKGMEIRKDEDGVSYLYDEEGERMGKAIASQSRVLDPGGVREKLNLLKIEIRNLPLSALFDTSDLAPYGLTPESFAELSKENPDPEVVNKIRKMMSYGTEITDIPQKYHDRIEALLQSLETIEKVKTA